MGGQSTRQVSQERWREAQQAELELWQRSQVKKGWKRLIWPVARPVLRLLGSKRVTGDDWNEWWAEQFDNYDFLPKHLGACIELGCGPYTNTRLVIRGRTTDRIVCSDPLARAYLEFTGRWLAEAHRSDLVEIDDHPIEMIPFAPASFDVVLMINVLEHVQDADLCLQKAIGLVAENGYFIMGNRVVDKDDLSSLEHDPWHPIRMTTEDFRLALEPLEPLLTKVIPPSAAPEGDERFSTLIYAGRRASPTWRS